jgi:hypothetical protein
MSTYTTKIWGQTYGIRANFADATDTIETYHDNTGWQSSSMQVADFRHSPKSAMVWWITADEDDYDQDDVDAAIDSMKIESAIVGEVDEGG